MEKLFKDINIRACHRTTACNATYHHLDIFIVSLCAKFCHVAFTMCTRNSYLQKHEESLIYLKRGRRGANNNLMSACYNHANKHQSTNMGGGINSENAGDYE
ncbi:hypothetical protein VCUG_02426 [Vavraia culicis subsp. floridensis]|uniref:Uncharacterized protein n=1 Tax=Vavraia culicis (isolate floridensis) TaxID=948595 RepID=L2GR13_VAVCU|nr:uncharacterized protein VCUG_02426 [Vavraia culicis subsp. floridensis]ELA46091.1 hypothetical protein VCUG_02426 [Vavraia culicis subsp. floridensis]